MLFLHGYCKATLHLVGLLRAQRPYIGSATLLSTFCQGFATMSKINGNEIRPGFIIEHDGGLWGAVKVNHVKPGKGGAFAQVELKNLRDGRKLNERFRSEDKVDQVELDIKEQQFLYENDGRLVFMDSETYEQTEIDAELLGDRRPFLQDGMTAKLQYYGDEALTVTIPILHRLSRGDYAQNETTVGQIEKAIAELQKKIEKLEAQKQEILEKSE